MDEDRTLEVPLGRIPERLGPYRLERRLGRGTMGVVYAASLLEDRPFGAAGMAVAVKVLHPAMQQDPRALARFLREGRAGGRIDHPGVVATYDADAVTVDGYLVSFIVQELIDGMSLAALLAELSVLPETLLRTLGAQVARGLEAIHGAALLHRDLKPANILLTRDQRGRIADLGLASLRDEAVSLTQSGDFVGTPLYAAPEQFGGHEVGPAADLYSLGVVLYECATGRQPFAAAGLPAVMARHLRHVPEPAAGLNPRLTPFIDRLIRVLLAKRPGERFVSAGALAEALEQGEESAWWRAQRDGPERPPGTPAAAARPARPIGRKKKVAAEPPGPRSARPGNLPGDLTSFIGRDQELAQLDRLVGEARLVTLTGVGGCGKTRLARRLAADLEGGYADGAWFVDLAPLFDPARVAGTVAAALGVREAGGEPIESLLVSHLEERELLLVLDNCEHVLGTTAGLVEELLQRAPRLRVIATSREPLGVAGEAVFVVLSLPPLESQALFVARARRALPAFAPGAEGEQAIPEICRRLDGMPLAIELAAARVRSLGVEQIARRLDDRFRLLTGGTRTALARQRSLQATMDWSHELLEPAERVLLRRLAVFAGGFTLEAAEAVAAGDGVEASAVLDLLGHLVDKSLLVAGAATGAEGVRYGLLETVREYARERLAESGEATAVSERHLDWFLALAEEGEPALRGPDQVAWLDRLEREHGNLQAALAASPEGPGGTEKALRMVRALHIFWEVHGHFSVARTWGAKVLARPDGRAPTALRAGTLVSAAGFTMRLGGHAEARAWLEEALAIWRQVGDRAGIADVLNNLGSLAMRRSDLTDARALFTESAAIFRELGLLRAMLSPLANGGDAARAAGDLATARAMSEECLVIARQAEDHRHTVGALLNLGNLAFVAGDLPAARAAYDESLSGARRAGWVEAVGYALNNLGGVAWTEHDLAAARSYYEESLAVWRGLGDPEGIARALFNLGAAVSSSGDLGRSQALHEEGLRLSREMSMLRWSAYNFSGLACVDALAGRTRRAALLYAAAERGLEQVGEAIDPAHQAWVERGVAAARQALGAEALASLWAEGRALTVDQALDLALALGS